MGQQDYHMNPTKTMPYSLTFGEEAILHLDIQPLSLIVADESTKKDTNTKLQLVEPEC